MKLVVNEAPALKSAMDAIVNLVDEGQFEITPEGLSLRAMDPSQISMVSFHMPKMSFVEYHVEDTMKIGLDMAQLSNVLSRGNKGEKAELSVEEGRLVVRFIMDKRKEHSKSRFLRLARECKESQRSNSKAL